MHRVCKNILVFITSRFVSGQHRWFAAGEPVSVLLRKQCDLCHEAVHTVRKLFFMTSTNLLFVDI